MTTSKFGLPFSQSCENNQHAILDVLKKYLIKSNTVLEIGSGTAQHITFFAHNLPCVSWQPSEMPEMISLTEKRLLTLNLPNVFPLLSLDVAQKDWPTDIDTVFTANTLHIMSWQHCLHFINNTAKVLPPKGLCFIYGPFNYNNQFTSKSNEQFDQWLKNRDPLSGIRNVETLQKNFQQNHVQLLEDIAMPANNRTLVWQKQE